MSSARRFDHIRILYDGECPFCSAYVKMARLKSLAGNVELLDARHSPELVAHHAAAGRDIDQGMIVEIDGAIYYGGEAMWAINTLLSPNSFFRLFSSKSFLVFIYPALRGARNLVVRMLGFRAINASR